MIKQKTLILFQSLRSCDWTPTSILIYGKECDGRDGGDLNQK